MKDTINIIPDNPASSNSAFTVLDDITKNIYNSRILDFQKPQNDLLDVLRTKADKVTSNTEGYYSTTIKDSWGFSVVPGGRNTTLPDGDYGLDVSRITLKLKQYYGNAELTAHDIEFEGGGYTEHNINVVNDSIEKMLENVKWAQSCWAFGDGTGQLATYKKESGDDTITLSKGSEVIIKCGNSYLDLGVDGAKYLAKGILLDIYASNGTTYRGTVRVSTVKRNRIRQSGVYDYFKAVVTQVSETGSARVMADGDKIYGNKWNERDASGNLARNEVMQGIRQIVNPAITGHAIWNVDPTVPFQNHHRGSDFQNIRSIARNHDDAEIFRSKLFRSNAAGTDVSLVDADNFTTYTGAGLADWDLGTIRQILDDVDFDSKNSAKVDTLFMNAAMANMFFKIAKDKLTITETQAQAISTSERGFDVARAKQFVREDGTMVTFHITPWMNNNEILGMTSGDLFVLEGPAGRFLSRNGGGIWEPTYVNNRDNYQAPYKGFMNMGAYRCDKCFWIQGLKDINN